MCGDLQLWVGIFTWKFSEVWKYPTNFRSNMSSIFCGRSIICKLPHLHFLIFAIDIGGRSHNGRPLRSTRQESSVNFLAHRLVDGICVTSRTEIWFLSTNRICLKKTRKKGIGEGCMSCLPELIRSIVSFCGLFHPSGWVQPLKRLDFLELWNTDVRTADGVLKQWHCKPEFRSADARHLLWPKEKTDLPNGTLLSNWNQSKHRSHIKYP